MHYPKHGPDSGSCGGGRGKPLDGFSTKGKDLARKLEGKITSVAEDAFARHGHVDLERRSRVKGISQGFHVYQEGLALAREKVEPHVLTLRA
jgi:hypothetical protein